MHDCVCNIYVAMESNNGAFKEKPDTSKDVMMEELNSIGPDDVTNDKEKSNTLMHHRFFHNTFFHSTLKDVKNRLREQAKSVTASQALTAIIIFFVIGIFSAPIILYYTLKTDPLPNLENVLRDVNVSTVNLHKS